MGGHEPSLGDLRRATEPFLKGEKSVGWKGWEDMHQYLNREHRMPMSTETMANCRVRDALATFR